MFNLNGFFVRPACVALISPVKQVPGQTEYAFRVVLDGGYEHICVCSSLEVATRSRAALIAACSNTEDVPAALPPAAVYAAAAPKPAAAVPPTPPSPAAPTRQPQAPVRPRGKTPRRASSRVN